MTMRSMLCGSCAKTLASACWVLSLAACKEPTSGSQESTSTAVSVPTIPVSGPITSTQPIEAPAALFKIPEGAVQIAKTAVAATQCQTPKECPQLKFGAAKHHCATFRSNEGLIWRLPTRVEAEAFRSISSPELGKAYHWTSSAFDRDPQQYWIVIPTQPELATTYRGEGKAFYTRCVTELK